MLVVLLVFFTLNVTTVSAESTYSEDNIFYAIGSFINSTQKGISKRLNEVEIINFGKNYAKSLMDNGSRMSDIVRVRGKEILFNPHGKMNIVNFIDGVYGAYNDFANYAVSRVEDDRYILNINKTYTMEYPNTRYDQQLGFMVVWGNPNDNLPHSYYDYHYVSEERVRDFGKVTIYAEGNKSTQPYYYLRRETGHSSDSASAHTITNGTAWKTYGDKTFGVGGGIPHNDINKFNKVESIRFHRVVFHGDAYVSDEDIVPYNSDDIPTKEDFVVNINNSYEPGHFYSYNFDEVLNETTVINNNYITNNYITVEEFIPEPDDEVIEDDEVVEDDDDNLPMLEKILKAIKDLPKNIADKLDFPEGSGGSEGGFWSSLFGAIGDLASAMSDFITGIPNMFIELFDGLLGLVEKVVELFVPSSEQIEELKSSLDLLVDDLTGKFDFVLEPVNQIKTVYSQPKSIYDLTLEYDGQVINVIPPFLKSSIDKLKVLLNGAVVLTTFITIYKRFVGREDMIK